MKNPFKRDPDAPKRTVRDWFIGDYDWGYLCKPQWPYCTGGKKRPAPNFFGKDAWLGLCTAAVMGFQHALAMIGGLITVPFLIGLNANGDKTLSPDEKLSIQQYLISAALIVCGIMTCIQVIGIRLPFGRQWGSGILSVMGISFTTYPIADSAIKELMKEGHTFSEAYGYVLGTAALCGIIPIVISFLPIKAIHGVFPPVVCGVTIMLIGINLTGKGLAAWGGGSGCSGIDSYAALPAKHAPSSSDVSCSFTNANGTWMRNSTGAWLTLPNGTTVNSTAYTASLGLPLALPVDCFLHSTVLCVNGDVKLPFGSPEYVGLGFSVFIMIIIIEVFGSPFLRNVAVIIGLLFGYMLAGVTTHDGQKYVTGNKISAAPAITFLWGHTFPLRIYSPIVLPMIIVFCITSIETVGDVSATEEASFLSTAGPSHDRRIRGSLLNDGVSGIFGALATSMPMTTFAQNNGVISLTAVASRQAGWACAAWLFCLGVLGKVGGIITTIPDCVFGGMTTFLFANVIASGIKIVVGEHLSRRVRFILACSLGLGIGVTLVPQWATNALWPCTGCSSGVKSLRDAIIEILSTGFCIGAIVAILLNAILPQEAPMVVPQLTTKGLPSTEKSVVYDTAPKPLDGMDDSSAKDSDSPTAERAEFQTAA